MSQPWFNPDAFVVAFVGGVGTLLGLAGVLARPGRRRWQVLVAVVVLLGGGAAAAAARGQPAGIWGPPALLALVCVAFAGLRWPPLHRAARAAAGLLTRPRVQWAALLLLSPAAAVALVYHANALPLPGRPDPLAGPLAAGPEVVKSGEYAVTDAGRRVPLYVLVEASKEEDLRRDEASLLRAREFVDRLIRTGPADERCNCHGWVFGGGRAWIQGDDVEQVLRDNGYYAVREPRPNDVAVYRDAGGHVSHTGLVRAAGDGVPVLVESKWRRFGRFIHPVGAQPYDGNCTFYRTSRPGHQLRGPGDETPSGTAPGQLR